VRTQDRGNETPKLMLDLADQMRTRTEISRDAERHGNRRDGQSDGGGDPAA
jgi:hypothetical protein